MFSVIVPVHNGEKTLRRCVESLAPQVQRILLIENGSKDRSRQLCHALAEEFPNVTALDGDTVGGVSKARNLGLKNTHFENPNGLDSPGHYSTARDLAKLAAYAMENPIFYKTVSA